MEGTLYLYFRLPIQISGHVFSPMSAYFESIMQLNCIALPTSDAVTRLTCKPSDLRSSPCQGNPRAWPRIASPSLFVFIGLLGAAPPAVRHTLLAKRVPSEMTISGRDP